MDVKLSWETAGAERDLESDTVRDFFGSLPRYVYESNVHKIDLQMRDGVDRSSCKLAKVRGGSEVRGRHPKATVEEDRGSGDRFVVRSDRLT